MKPYKFHIFICQGKRCISKGSEDILDEFKTRIRQEGIEGVKISRSGCIKACKETLTEGEYSPAVVIYPEGVWYRNVTAGDVAEIIDGHVKQGRTVERLLHFRLSG